MSRRALFCLSLAALLPALDVAAADPFDPAAFSPRAAVSPGDTARIARVLTKSRRGEKVTLAVIGGSITQGAKAASPDKRYGNVVAAWWRAKFPKAEVEFVNAGIGATGSNFGALRAQRDLLSRRPDFVIVEYAVNDGPTPEAAECLEGLLRQILSQPQQPAAILLFMMHRNGGNAQARHAPVGAHYKLPMVSFRDALWPEISAGRIAWDAIEADQVHSNDFGHACAARFVTDRLEAILKDLPADDRLPPVAALPKPITSDLFEHVTLTSGADLKPVANKGWSYDARFKCWRSTTPGSLLEFETAGRLICATHLVVRRGMGKARMQVDDGPSVVRNGWFDQTWGGYQATFTLARDLKPGPHRVRIELLADKSPESDGHEFCIYAIGAAGVGP